MWNWPSASRTGHSFQTCGSPAVMFHHCLGLRYSVHRQLPFRFLSLWRSLLTPSLTSCFLTQPHQLCIPSPAFIFSVSLSLWSFPLDDKYASQDILRNALFFLSDVLSPPSSLSLLSPPTFLKDPSLSHDPTCLPASPGLTVCLFITIGQPWLFLSPQEASVRACIWCQVSSGSSLVLHFFF